jgi:hypothetical protein
MTWPGCLLEHGWDAEIKVLGTWGYTTISGIFLSFSGDEGRPHMRMDSGMK